MSIGISSVIYLIGHIIMMQIDSINFGFWFGFYSSFPYWIIPGIHLFKKRATLCPRVRRLLVSIGISSVIHLIGHIIMMQIDSINFGFWFGFYSSFPYWIIPGIHLFKKRSTLCPRVRRLLVSIGILSVIHLIGHIIMMQLDSFNFGFWFGF